MFASASPLLEGSRPLVLSPGKVVGGRAVRSVPVGVPAPTETWVHGRVVWEVGGGVSADGLHMSQHLQVAQCMCGAASGVLHWHALPARAAILIGRLLCIHVGVGYVVCFIVGQCARAASQLRSGRLA